MPVRGIDFRRWLARTFLPTQWEAAGAFVFERVFVDIGLLP